MYFPDSTDILKGTLMFTTGLPDERRIAEHIAELGRLLRPGGLIFFSSPVSVHAITLIHSTIQSLSLADPPSFPPGLPAFESNRADSAKALLERAGFVDAAAQEVVFDAPMDSAKMAAEASSPVLMNMGKSWTAEVRRDVMVKMRQRLEEQ